LVIRKAVDVPLMIAKTLVHSPDATIDEIVDQLGEAGVQVSGVIVSMWLSRWREQATAIPSVDRPEIIRTTPDQARTRGEYFAGLAVT
jgi:hypothetical protein